MNKEEILKKEKAILAQVEEVEEEVEKIGGMKKGPERENALSALKSKIKKLKTEVEELEKETEKRN